MCCALKEVRNNCRGFFFLAVFPHIYLRDIQGPRSDNLFKTLLSVSGENWNIARESGNSDPMKL